MGRLLELQPRVPVLKRTDQKDGDLEGRCSWEVENALSARHPQEAEWREARRQYAALPMRPYRNNPVPDAPNIEVPLGATHSDALYAQMIDTLYSGDPLLTCRAQDHNYRDAAKAMQRWINYVAEQEVNLRFATDHAFANCIQMGTAAYYVPWTREYLETKTHRITDEGPRIIPIAPENLLFMGGSRGDVEADRWIGLRFWMTPSELNAYKKHGWDVSKAMPVAMTDWVRQQAENVGLTYGSNNFYEYFEIYRLAMRYDYDGTGVDQDLEVIWDRSSQKVLQVTYYPYDCRNIVPMRYQLRPDLAYGLGVMAMLRPHQQENTEVHNYRLLNMFLANTRMWSAVEGSIAETLTVYPGKVIPVREPGALQEHRLSDVYPSSGEAESIINAMAERRVGTEGMAGTSGQSPHLGTRTPGITALSQLQAQNRRFIPPFDQMRLATGEALRQALLRQRERLMTPSTTAKMEARIRAVMGDDAETVIRTLKMEDYRKYVGVDFTSATPTTNKEADRQAALQVWNALMTQYYKPAMELIAAVSNPQSPPELRDTAKQIIEKVNNLADVFLRTFDQFRDPVDLLLDTSAVPDANQQPQINPAQLIQQLAGGAGQDASQQGTEPMPDLGGGMAG